MGDMAPEAKFKGLLLAAVFTPFDEKNEVNFEEIPKYGKYLADNNVQGVLINGTMGEGTSLTFEERKKILEAWVEVSKSTKLRIFVQVGGTNLKQVKELAKHAESFNVSGIVCLPDLFFKPKTVEELIFYLQAVSYSAPVTPLIYYHVPSFTGVQLDMRKLLELGSKQIPTLAGLKFSHPVLGDALRCLPVEGGRFTIFHGYDQGAIQTLNISFFINVQQDAQSTNQSLLLFYSELKNDFHNANFYRKGKKIGYTVFLHCVILMHVMLFPLHKIAN